MKNNYIIFFLFLYTHTFSQVGIGTKTPANSAILEVKSSNKGILIPRILLSSNIDTTTISSPALGLLIYNTSTSGSNQNKVYPGFYYFNGVNWEMIQTATPKKTISFDNLNPNSLGTNFNPNNAQDKNYTYISSLDGSQWKWNGTEYQVTNIIHSPFYLSADSNDAGNNKKDNIYRWGRVGIGTSTPYSALHVQGDEYTQALFKTKGTLDRTSVIAIANNNPSSSFWEIGNGGIGNGLGLLDGQFYLYNSSLSNNAITILRSNNNIGIGTNSPYSQLSNTNLPIQGIGNISALSNGLVWVTTGSGFGASFYNKHAHGAGLMVKVTGTSDTTYAFQVNQGVSQSGSTFPLFSVLGSGKVGVGINTPSEKLEINGAIKIGTQYSGVFNGATTPIPAGGSGTIIFNGTNFYGWNGSTWKQLDN